MYSSIKIKDYKCFVKENDYQGFDDIKPVNVIIGKIIVENPSYWKHLRVLLKEHWRVCLFV